MVQRDAASLASWGLATVLLALPLAPVRCGVLVGTLQATGPVGGNSAGRDGDLQAGVKQAGYAFRSRVKTGWNASMRWGNTVM